MSRKIVIDKYEKNTHYSVSVFDSYGIEHHLGYYTWLNDEEIDKKAKIIWTNEVKPKEDLLDNAISECVKMDEERGVEPNLD